MISDPGKRAGSLVSVAVVILCLSTVLIAGGCASVPNSNAHSPTPAGDPTPVTPSPQTAVSVATTPATATLLPGQTQSFSATVAHDPKNQGVSWTLSNCAGAACGTLSATTSVSGAAITYTAPGQIAAAYSVQLTATSIFDGAKTSASTINLVAPISIAVSPASTAVQPMQSQNFTAVVQNDTQNKGVSWSLSGPGCSGAGCGTLSSAVTPSGVPVTYTAPQTLPTPPTITLAATSVADGTRVATAAVTVSTSASPISVSVSPNSKALVPGGTQTFTASVQNDTQNKGVGWSLSGAGCSGATCGSLSSATTPSGMPVTYTAPQSLPSPSTITLTATSIADGTRSATAMVTVTSAPAPIAVTVAPASTNVFPNGTQTFTATVQNDAQNKGVNWTLSGAGCSGAKCGTLSASASASGAAITYNAPNKIPNPPTITLTATSVSDSTRSTMASITVTAAPLPITVSVSPSSKTLLVNSSQAFTATVQNDAQMRGVAWKISGAGCAGNACGTLSSSSSASGVAITYTAPAAAPNPGPVTLTATSISSASSSASATITVFTVPSNLSVSITPKRGGLTLSQTLKFTATVQNDPTTQGVTWSASAGTFTNSTGTSAVYHAPTAAGVYTITATSNLDASKSASASIGVTDLSGVTTYHNDLARDGVNTQEYALTTANVNTSTFAKLFACTVDAAMYSQPLWVANLSIGGGTHNVIFATSSHNSVYAFDADASPCVTYWSKNLIPSGETWPNSTDMGSLDIQPDVGIVGTPVIDPAANILYVVTKTKLNGTNARPAGDCRQRLHALRLSNGSETSGAPVDLTSSITVAGTGGGSSGGRVPFDAFHENQRPGLALVAGTLYVTWGSHNDQQPWHGWVIGFNTANLQAAPLLFNASPNGMGAGIWMAGGAPSVDSNNNIYVMTGNGDYNGVTEFGDSFLKLNTSLTLTDWFTPFDEATMNSSNADLGSGGAAVLTDLPNAPVKHLLIGGGKTGSGNAGELYVLNRDAMGHLENTGTAIVQKFPVTRPLFATPAFWKNTLYIAGLNGTMNAYALDPNTGLFNTSPTSQSVTLFPGRGATPSVSSNGGAHGILWALDNNLYGVPSKLPAGPTVLHAYDATNLGRELWNSGQAAGGADQAGNAVKFAVPTVANGKVYVGTSTEVDVYGLLPN